MGAEYAVPALVQYSVFECRLDEGELQRLRDRVRALIATGRQRSLVPALPPAPHARHQPATPMAAGSACRTYPCCTNHAAARRNAS